MEKHIQPEYKKEYEFLIKSLYSSVFMNDSVLPPKDINWKLLAYLAKFNTCQNLFFNAVQKLPDEYKPPQEIYKSLENEKNLYFVHDTNQMYELEQVFSDFEKNEIYFMPLKGYVIKPDYPQSDFRLMTDADILFKEDQIESVKKVFEDHGFEYEYFDDDNQYHFAKKPYVYIEMHTSLVNHNNEKYDYYTHIWEKSSAKAGHKFFYEMTLEDYYIFMIEHASNHFKLGGVGLRQILDIYVFNKKHSHQLNYGYLEEQLEILNLYVFEQQMSFIATKWYEKQDFETLSLLEEFVLLSSTLGRNTVYYANLSLDHKRKAESENRKESKLNFIFSTIFPDIKTMKRYYPYLSKAPLLLPFSWIQFWCRRVFIEKNVHYKSGLKSRMNYINDEDEKYINDVLKIVGFKEK